MQQPLMQRSVTHHWRGVPPASLPLSLVNSAQLCLLSLCLLLLGGVPLAGQEPVVLKQNYADELPRLAPLEPQEALKAFALGANFEIQSLASEPLVTDPVAMAFDENGRLFVVEMRGYSEQGDENRGQIRLLEDTTGDGRFDRSVVYATGLSWPTAAICYDGGLFVGAAPDIFYLKDTDGDDISDTRQIVFTGFGRSNVQGLFNSFTWGLDNRIHGATSSSGALVRQLEHPEEKPLPLRGRDFAIDPRTMRIEPTSGGGQHGLSFDDWGREFVSSNSDHIQQIMFEDRYLQRNASMASASARRSIAADGPQAEVYRTSPVEPWRVVRTRLRVAGLVPGPVEGGGRAAGYFTGATGVTIYRGNAWPEDHQGEAIIGDVGSNIVHRKRLVGDGLELTAYRIDPHREFLSSTDTWFRPVQFANAPDGALYIADMYREVIEHPASLPPMIKQHLDLTSGRDRGRIYRIVPQGFQQPKPVALGGATVAQLVSTLTHPNGWHRDTAARLLYQQNDSHLGELVRREYVHTSDPRGRMHLLYALAGADILTPADLLPGMQDEHPGVRTHAVRLSESYLRNIPRNESPKESPKLLNQILSMADDPSIHVRYQVAFSLGEVGADVKHSDSEPHGQAEQREPSQGQRKTPVATALATLAKRDGDNRWMQIAIQSSLGDSSVGVLIAVLDADSSGKSTNRLFWIESLARQVGAQNREPELREIFSHRSLQSATIGAKVSLLSGLATGLSGAGVSWRERLSQTGGESFDSVVSQLAGELITTVDGRSESTGIHSPDVILQAVRSLWLVPLGRTEEVFATLLGAQQSSEMQRTALRSLSRYTGDAVAPLILERWNMFTPRLRRAAGDLLLSRRNWTAAFLDAMEAQEVRPGDLDPAQRQLLLGTSDASLKVRAKKLLATQSATGQELVRKYRQSLTIKGSAPAGLEVFRRTCAACHRAGKVGHNIGPDLATLQNRGNESILVNVLDPNREVNPRYINYVVITNDGRTTTGMLENESATSLTLRRAEAESEIILRNQIDEIRATGLSLMPEGMDKQINIQQMADLLAYIQTIK